MAEGPCPRLAVCVLGLSREKGEHFIQRSGIGKSCFCYRFMHPGYDDYVADHPSLLALHEFESQHINNVHFLYWGSTIKNFPLHGGPKQQRIEFHVVEQTVFYQDVTSQPFTIITKPDSLDHYIRRATGQIESPGKVSYESRDTMSFQETACQLYPSGISGWPRGFIVVIDVSQSGAAFNSQIARAEKIMEYLMKHKRKFVVVAAKRDIMDATSIDRVHSLKKKYKTHIFETSANGNLNISETFRYIASKVLQKKVQGISDQIPSYEQAAHNLLTQKGRARRYFMNFLKKRVVNSDERLNALERMEEYKDCTCVIGKFETDRLFAEHLLEVHNKKVELYAGVRENPEMRLEFLEDFLDQRADLAIYSESLKRWIKMYVETHPVSSDEESPPEPEKKKMPGAKEMTDQAGYQIFEKPGSPSAQSHHTLDSGVQQDSATLDSNTSTFCEEGGSGDSYYSDSFDSAPEYEDIVEYINFPLPPSEKLCPIVATDGGEGATVPMDGGEGTDGGATLGSEIQEPDSELQASPPIPENEPPQMGPESTVPSVSELQATFTVEGEADVEHPSSQDYLHILATEAPSDERVKEEEKENGNVQELTAKLNEQLSSPSLAKPKASVPPPPSKKPSRTLTKSTSQEPVKSPPGSGDIKSRASQLQKLLSGKEEEEKVEELMPTSSESLKQPNSPLMIHQETPAGSKKPMKPAPKPPVSPKSTKKHSLGERSGKQISQSSLQDEQLQSPPSPPPPSHSPPPTHQAPQPRAVTEDNPSNEYEARLPFIKKKIAERREQQQKESALAGPLGTPEIPSIFQTGPSPTVSPDSSPPPPPPPPRRRSPSSPLHSQSQIVSSSSPPPCPPRHSSPTHPPSPLHHRKQMPLPSSPPHQERMPPPCYTPPPPPSPSSTQKQTADQGAPTSQFSVDTQVQPPLPQRTLEMFLVQAPPGDGSSKQESPQHTGKKTNIREVEEKGGEGKGKKKRFYQDVVLPKLKKVLGNSKEEKEKGKEKGKEKKDVEEKQEKEVQVKSPSFMNMRQRPLPVEPFADETETEHEAWEYEPIDTAEMLKQRPEPYATHFSPSHSSLSAGHFSPPFSHHSPSPSHLGAHSNSPNSVRRVQSFQPFDTRQTGAQKDIRAYKYPSPPFLTRARTVQQSENGAVDADGYVDTESSSPPGVSLPEYDYPDTRAFCTLPNRMVRAPVELPPRNAGRSMTRTLSASSDYIPMTSAVDDSYINWETIGSIRTQLISPERHNPPVPTKSGRPPPRFALDDLATVYMNLPVPEKPLVLPPRRQEREQQPTLKTVPGSSSVRPIPSPRMPRPPACESPSTSKKPKPRPRAKTNTSLESDHFTPVAMVTQVNPVTSLPPSTSSISEEMDLLRPKCSPNPRHPQLNRAEEIMISSSLPPSFGDSFGESFGGFSHHSPPEVPRRKLSGANEPQAVSLPPRNILRPKKICD